ncbi:MAG: TetR/AcrR family transcriptional regulator, partial [Sideroxydans sp.]|nr:TetR/AcrR family transcriptional regulator [Sideroxydans sp.]
MPENTTITKKSNTKQKIIRASATLFSEYGYKATSVRKIASEVGIRESALYNHFKNKEEIFLCVAKEIFTTPFSDESSDIKESALKGKAFLQKFAMQYKLLTFDKKNENMFRLLMIELFQNKELR